MSTSPTFVYGAQTLLCPLGVRGALHCTNRSTPSVVRALVEQHGNLRNLTVLAQFGAKSEGCDTLAAAKLGDARVFGSSCVVRELPVEPVIVPPLAT